MRLLILAALLPGHISAADRYVIDNDFVRVIQASVPPRVKGALHRHEFNRVIIALDPGDLDVVSAEGNVEHQHWKSGEVEWSPATGLHTSENVGTRPFRLVEVEIKKTPPAALPQRNLKLDPVALDPSHNVLLFENPQVRVFRSRREPGASEQMHEHAGSGRLSVLLTELDARMKSPGGATVPLHGAEGDVLWSGPVTHAATNTGAAPLEMIVIEIK